MTISIQYIEAKKKENCFWYPSVLKKLPATLFLLVNKLQEKSNANAIFILKIALPEIDPMEDIYKLSKMLVKV